LIAGAALCLAALPAGAADGAAPGPSGPDTGSAVFRRLAPTPVEAFRKLLAMPPADRNQFLTNYPAATRERILAKLDEYQTLPPDFCDLRLRVTELRWYLLPLLKAPPAARAEMLKSVPEPYRGLIQARLEEWDIWPEDLKAEVLEYESTFSRFVGLDATGHVVLQQQVALEDIPEKDRPQAERKLAEWQALPQGQREQMFKSFVHYFELSDDEKQKTLGALPEPERTHTERALAPIERGSPADQQRYISAFHQFAAMSPEQRQSFMRNTERWQKMSPEERQAWRDLVRRASVQPPPAAAR
jgi:hypothetical protein